MLKPLRLTNTLSGAIEPLEPIAPPKLGFYACGPTVYNRAHVGNFRTFVAIDVLRRTLTHLGYRVHEVMNVTDVDDRIIQLAQQAGQDLASFTAQHIRGFEEDMKTLRIQKPEHVPRATEHIQDMIALVERLTARGHTYTADGSVYFRIASFPEYGKLARLDAAGIQDGARVDSDKYDKENARDFVLWKFKSDEPAWAQWDAPFGWAPLQLIAVEGLRRYGYQADADRIARKFIALVTKEFEEHGTIVEKYDVRRRESDVAADIKFGYSANQIGFGWTNAAFLDLLAGLERKARPRVADIRIRPRLQSRGSAAAR